MIQLYMADSPRMFWDASVSPHNYLLSLPHNVLLGKAMTQSEASTIIQNGKVLCPSYRKPVDLNEKDHYECSKDIVLMDMHGIVFKAEQVRPTGKLE
jgi:hypothetical protein